MEINWFIILATGIIPLLVGGLWYSPMLFGNVWAKEAGVSEADLKNSNMVKIFGLTLVLGIMLAVALSGMVIHQMGVLAALGGPAVLAENAELNKEFLDFMSKHGNNHRSFGHGVLHGVMAGLFIFLPVLGVNTLFERKTLKYLLLHVGFWTICAAIMGGIICAFA
ncbi:MAG: DUF1761 domain-containing protein [Saprospiraceae bacterium]|nr:DUF1761 domain-containing protein [Saprospiraceae bacterium]